MKRYIYKFIAAALIIVGLSSCEDFLTKVNPNEMSVENFWSDLTDCEKGLIAVYNQLRNTGMMQLGDETHRSDLSYPGYGRPNTTNEAYLHTFTDGYGSANSKWDNLYKGIYRTNQVIKGLKGIKPDMETEDQMAQWTFLMGQARFFRGLFHFWLNISFNNGSVIVMDTVIDNREDYHQSLSPAKEVVGAFREDLEYAYNSLEYSYNLRGDNGDLTDPQVAGLANRAAAAVALGKSYLYEKNYTEAAKLFKEVIDCGFFQLTDVSNNMTTQGEFNEESILEIAYNTSFKEEYDEWSPLGTTNANARMISPKGGWRGVLPSLWLTHAYMTDSIDINDSRNYTELETPDPNDPNAIITERVYRKYSLRTSYSVALVDDKSMLYYKDSVHLAQFNNKETAYFRKNTNWDITDDEQNTTPPGRSGVNYRVMRLADVYLMYAECLLLGGNGNVDEALMYVNRVRQRSALQLLGSTPSAEFPSADVDGVTYDASKLMEHIMYLERPLELALEGQAIRQIDLRRWGVTKERFEYLATQDWHTGNFKYVDEDGKEQTKWGSTLEVGLNPDRDDPDPKISGPALASEMKDYEQSAKNYIPSLHSYWPIPNSETTANPNL